MRAARPLLVLSLLGEAALLLLDDDQQSSRRALIAALRGQSRLAPPSRKHSVAELEEQQRAPGATVEYLDDLSAALATSKVLRARLEQFQLSTDSNGHAGRKKKDCFHGCTSDPSFDAEKIRKLQTDSNTQRCGFSWNDAAAKCGPPCPLGLQSECDVNAPKVAANSTWKQQNNTYRCYADLPSCDPAKPLGECFSRRGSMYDAYCTTMCNSPEYQCNWDQCVCEEHEFPLGAPIEPEPALTLIPPRKMKLKARNLVEQVLRRGERHLGLPECKWQPGPGCTNTTPYECIETGQCSSKNWFESDVGPTRVGSCQASCIHASTFHPAPYYALWRPGPISRDFQGNETIPHYQHDDMRQQLRFTRNAARGSVLMSSFCKQKINEFVGVSLYSPKYEPKARRLIHSCQGVGVCCKATLLPPNVYGPNAPEGSEEFRFRTIALKPAFILSQLKATQLPVVFLDVDLEFHKFPELFMPGSWPDGDRDVALFNYWGNETNLTARRTPNTGSGVAFFNQTYKAKKVLIAWAEAMAYGPNKRAPDDQVLDLLLVEGGWMKRASFGWLPAAYLRTVPAYYRGVDPVIDHDHGNPPGLLNHSEAKPQLPPVCVPGSVSTFCRNPP